jgi:hypothetical protein
MVSIREAAARPPEIGSADALHIVYEALSDSAYVLNLRLKTHPYAVVNHTTEVLNKLTVDVATDFGAVFRQLNFDIGLSGKGWTYIGNEARRNTGTRSKKISAIHFFWIIS